jgi:hypothetical protein
MARAASEDAARASATIVNDAIAERPHAPRPTADGASVLILGATSPTVNGATALIPDATN